MNIPNAMQDNFFEVLNMFLSVLGAFCWYYVSRGLCNVYVAYFPGV